MPARAESFLFATASIPALGSTHSPKFLLNLFQKFQFWVNTTRKSHFILHLTHIYRGREVSRAIMNKTTYSVTTGEVQQRCHSFRKMSMYVLYYTKAQIYGIIFFYVHGTVHPYNIVLVNNQRDAAFVLLGLLSLYMFRTWFVSITFTDTTRDRTTSPHTH